MDTFQRALDDTSGGAITAQKQRARERRQRRQRQQQQQQQQQGPEGGQPTQGAPGAQRTGVGVSSVNPESASTGNAGEATATTLEQSLAPVLQAEKSDLMFWMTVLQVLLLVGIWRNTKSGG